MNTTFGMRMRRLRFALQALAATFVIVLGMLAGLTQLAMPWLQSHPQHVEHWLSAKLARPVHIGHLTGSWIGGGPVLTLDDVDIAANAAGQGALSIPRAELAFDLSALVRSNRAVVEFRIAGLNLRLVDEQGSWRLHGLDLGPASTRGDDEPFSMGALGALEIRDLDLTIENPQRGLHVDLKAPVLRLLNHGAITRALGRVRIGAASSPLLEFVADLDIQRRSGEIYVGGRDIDLAAFSGHALPVGLQLVAGRGVVQAWMRVDSGRVDDARARVDLDDAVFAAAAPIALDAATRITPRVELDRLAFVARWLRSRDGWTFDVADLRAGSDAKEPAARVSVEYAGGAAPQWRAAASALPLRPIGDFAMLGAGDLDVLRRWLYLARPRGTLASGDLLWRGASDYEVHARLSGLGFSDADAVPGLEHADLEVDGDAEATLVHLPAQALRIDYPHVFRRPFLFATFAGDIVVVPGKDAWVLQTDRIGFEGEAYAGELRGSMEINAGRRPSVDLYARVTHADVTAAKLFWPTNTMPPQAIVWLDRALVGGQVVDGVAALRGDLADWPFHHLDGRMNARADISDLTLDYAPGWPRAEKVHAIATFINDGVDVEADAAESMGNQVGQASATIADFGDLNLELAAKGEGSGANLLRFLRATPVGADHREYLQDLAVGGKATVAFTLHLPIKQIEALKLDGTAALSGAKVDHDRYDLHFVDATGPLRFNQSGFAADALDVGFRERKAKLSVAAGGLVADPRHVFEAGLTGVFPATAVFADVPVLAPALPRFPGESKWSASVSVDASQGGANASRLELASDLAGTAIELPAPLAKPADASVPFRLVLDLPYAGAAFSARLGDRVGVTGRVPGPGQAFAAYVEFGGDSKPVPKQGVTIGGDMPALDAGAWLDLAGPPGSGSLGSLLNAIDVHTRDFVLANRHFQDVALGITSDARATTVKFEGGALAGTLLLPANDLATRGIDAKFARIHWPEAPADTPDDSAAFADVAPGVLPPLHLEVADFRLGQATFGSARFESHPIAGGMQIDTLESHSPNVAMTASGTWIGTAQDNHSHLSIDLSAQSLGHMMDALGFAGLIEGGSTHAKIDASWPGSPSAFALARVDGTLAVDVAEGRILDVNPGAGRLFGLLSLTEIPRRLSLDFSDFFKSGLSFNSITGKFRLADGNAYTDGLKISSPAAEIVISGRTGLRARDYDQQMSVHPHAGATLPIVGAIAAGPVGAAAGLVMQGLLNKPIGKAIARRYSVTGSWDKPVIVQEARGKTDEGGSEKGVGSRD